MTSMKPPSSLRLLSPEPGTDPFMGLEASGALARPGATEAVLEVSGLGASYGATPILQGVDMRIAKGEIVGLIGRNGVGKTTTMRCLIGLLRATHGSITLQGQDITEIGRAHV